MRIHSSGTKLIYVPLEKCFEVENASFRRRCIFLLVLLPRKNALQQNRSPAILAAQKRRLTHIDWSPNDIAVTSRLNSNTVSELGSNPRISPTPLFFPSPFTFSRHKVVTYPRYVDPWRGFFLARLLLHRLHSGLENSAIISDANWPFLSLFLSLIHSARVCETLLHMYEDDTSQGSSLNRKYTS